MSCNVTRSSLWKKIWIICSIIFSAVFVTGCWDRVELMDLAFIKAAAFDKTKDNKLEVTAAVLIPTQGGQGAGGSDGSEKSSVFVRSAVGENIADAISKLQEKLPRKIFWGHNKAFIIGESLAKKGILGEFDFIIREIGARERSYIFVSEGNAKKTIEVKPVLERNEAEVLRKLAESKVVLGVTVLDFWKEISGDTKTSAIPKIRLLPASKLAKQKVPAIAYIDKVAIFKNDKMVGEVSDAVARGIQWLRNDIREPIITIHTKENKGTISMKMLHAQTKLYPQIEGGKWKMIVKGSTEDDIIQNNTKLDLSNPVLIKKLEKELSKAIAERMYLTLDQIQKGLHADIFRFGAAFHRKYPQEWEKVKGNWEKTFPKVEVQIKLDAHILRPGNATNTTGIS